MRTSFEKIAQLFDRKYRFYSCIAKKRHNIIFIVADTLAAKHMSLYGYERKTTPFLDEFFSTNTLFYTNARSNASWTLPSFASFMRSRLPSSLTMGDLVSRKSTLPECFFNAGYEQKAFLKNFNNPIAILQSVALLFREEHWEQTYGYHDHETGFLDASAWLTEKGQEISDRPFFLFYHDSTAHSPYEETPQKYKQYFSQGIDLSGPDTTREYILGFKESNQASKEEKYRLEVLYDQGVRYLDDLMRQFITSIPSSILEQSIVVFVSDHGEEFGNHFGRFGHGRSIYDELTHVPLCIKIPGINQSVVDTPVSLLDFAPTLHALSGIANPESYAGELLPVKTSISKKDIVMEGDGMSFKRLTDLFVLKHERYTESRFSCTAPERAYLREYIKLIVSNRGSELYDLKSDPGETWNRIHDWNIDSQFE